MSIVSVSLLLKEKQTINNSKAATSALTVDANTFVNNFSSGMLGQDYVNWMHAKPWGKPFLNDVPQLANVMKEIKPGIIRYAGGNWANSVGFDSTIQRTPYTAWKYKTYPETYYFHYGTDEMKSVSDFAKSVGADVMIEVNIFINRPEMWVDMVNYSKANNLNFKYWEIGNEQDLSSGNPLTPAEYATRFTAYQKAMLAADPSIQIIGPAAAAAVATTGVNSTINPLLTSSLQAAHDAGKDLSAVTYHWYSQCNLDPTNITNLLKYNWIAAPLTSWRNNYSRSWGTIIPNYMNTNVLNTYPNTKLGISEFNVDACSKSSVVNGNHLAAIYMSDVLGRMAYSGADFATIWEGYSTESHGIVYPDSDVATKNIFLRPSFNAYVMYAKYFGNQMVKSTTYDDQNISIWASKDTNDPGKLKLIVTNLSATDISVPVNVTGFNSTSAQVYEMTNANPTDISATSVNEGQTKINNVALHGMTLSADIKTIQPKNITVAGNTFTYNFKSYSSTAIILAQSGITSTPVATTTIQATSIPVTTTVSATTTIPVTTTVNPACLCGTNGMCSTSCSFANSANPTSVRCTRSVADSTNPGIGAQSQTDKNAICSRKFINQGDSDGLGTVDPTTGTTKYVTYSDYLWYLRYVTGGTIPSNIFPDFNGDGTVDRNDLNIVTGTIASGL